MYMNFFDEEKHVVQHQMITANHKKQTTQDNDFSALLCVGRYKNLGLLKLFSLDMHLSYLGFPGGSDSEEFACNTGNLGLISGSGRSPGERIGYPLIPPVFLPGECHGHHGVSKSCK